MSDTTNAARKAADKARYAAWLKFIGGIRVSVPNFSWDNEILADAVRNAYEESLDVLAAHPGARAAHDVCEDSRDCIACGERIEPAFGVCYSCAVADPKIHAERTRAAQTPSEGVQR